MPYIRVAKENSGSVELHDEDHGTTRPPLPPFIQETASQKVRLAEDGWNSHDPEKVALAYALDSLLRRNTWVSFKEELHSLLVAIAALAWRQRSSL